MPPRCMVIKNGFNHQTYGNLRFSITKPMGIKKFNCQGNGD